MVSLGIRFRRSWGEERQQLKWFTYAGALVPLALLGDALPAPLGNIAFTVPIVFLPVAAGIAILRYRLYDIDRLINRTLVYGLLTALLGGVYVGTVLVLGQLFGGVAGNPSSWAVAGATLAVAALFQPARRHIQQAVDRRFNRRRYDAAKTVEAFSARLRDEIELDTSRPSCWQSSTKRSSRPRPRYGSGQTQVTSHGQGQASCPTPKSAMTPCMPCSVVPCGGSRSVAGAQRNGRLGVTVIDRWIPLVTAAYGTRVARTVRTTMCPPDSNGSNWSRG